MTAPRPETPTEIATEIVRRANAYPRLVGSLRSMAHALRESSEDRGLIAQHGDILDTALVLLRELGETQ